LPVYHALVTTLQGEAGLSNNEGEVTLKKLPPAWWSYKVEHQDYFTHSDSLVIAEDTTSLFVYLSKKTANVTIILTDSDGPVSNAMILFDTYTASSSIEGMAWFFFLEARQDHHILVNANDFETFLDTFYLENDTTINILLQPLSNNDVLLSNKLKIYPNPVSDILNVENAENFNQVYLISIDGKILSHSEINNGKAAIEVSGLISGMYYLHFRSIDKTMVRKIIKTSTGRIR
jgi:hypothetical protein